MSEFSELTSTQLMDKIRERGIQCMPLWGMPFVDITPKQTKTFPLRQQYKPSEAEPGMQTKFMKVQHANEELVQRAASKMAGGGFSGIDYSVPEASFKLHLSLNRIGNVDEAVILELIQFLTDEAESPENNLLFHFKIIYPEKSYDNRFRLNDQLTLYFDKYSSVGDMMKLADKIDQFLLNKNIPKNTKPLGPKDNIGLNSFVTARFDTNKLLHKYDVFTFFDIEIRKFLEQHRESQMELLEKIPVCAFDAVFIKLITHPTITIPAWYAEKPELSDADSRFIQEEFRKMAKNPAAYMEGVEAEQAQQPEPSKQEILEAITTIDIHSDNLDYLVNRQEAIRQISKHEELLPIINEKVSELNVIIKAKTNHSHEFGELLTQIKAASESRLRPYFSIFVLAHRERENSFLKAMSLISDPNDLKKLIQSQLDRYENKDTPLPECLNALDEKTYKHLSRQMHYTYHGFGGYFSFLKQCEKNLENFSRQDNPNKQLTPQ